MKAQSTFQDLVNMCNKFGWDESIEELERQVLKIENFQAGLFAGTPTQVRQATRLSQTIIRQNNTIAKLNEYRKSAEESNQH